MKISIQETNYSLDTPFNSGGEGDVYQITDEQNKLKAVKIYHTDELSSERKQKVLSLCKAYSDNIDKFGEHNFAFPEHPAYKKNFLVFEEVLGFSMPMFSECPHIDDLKFDINYSSFKEVNGKQFDNKTCISFIYEIFELAEKLHDSRIVLGDVNTGNILCQWAGNTPKPILIDLDAVQFGSFYCTVHSAQFLDPDLEVNRKNSDEFYIYSSSSDIFSLAALCYRILVGFDPYLINIKPRVGENERKLNNYSVLRYLTEGGSFLTEKNIEYLSHRNKAHEDRLKELKNIDSNLYNFFVSVLVKGQRKNLITLLPPMGKYSSRNPYVEKIIHETGLNKVLSTLKESRGPKKTFTQSTITKKYKAPPVQPITRKKTKDNDPQEFITFLSGYGIEII